MASKIAIVGYGNLGRGVELALAQNADLELCGIFTRRAPETIKTVTGAPVFSMEALDAANDIDALIICGGSATDLPQQTPALAAKFNVIDSFDTHAKISEHYAKVDAAAKKAGKIGIISCGWDPGMFSLNRLYAGAILNNGSDYTFWGPGVSQGHSDAVRRIDGVLDARQYTLPIDSALDAVRSGACPKLTTAQKHTRLCYVVAEDGADKARIESEIVNMPNYFSDYETTVRFIDAAEMKEKHSGLPHGGSVIRTGTTGLNGENTHCIEYTLKLASNPEFTACVLAACARAAVRMNAEGQSGCRTILDIPPAFLSARSGEELRSSLL